MSEQSKKTDFLARLKSTFRVEAEEHIEALTSGFIQLEKSKDLDQQKQIIETLFRETHTLKGAARSVNFTNIESICHVLEKVLQKFKHSGFVSRPGLFDVLHQTVDIIDKLNAAGTEKPAQTQEIPRIIQLLTDLENTPADIPPGENIERKNIRAEDKDKVKENRRHVIESIEERRLQKKLVRPSIVNAPHISYPDNAGSEVLPSLAASTIRVSAAKLDKVLLQAEELIYGKLSLNRLVRYFDNIREELDNWRKKPHTITSSAIKQVQETLRKISRALENDRHFFEPLVKNHLENMKELLMLPFSTLTEGFPKLVRDLARDMGKKVDISIKGVEIEIDKRILEGLKVPLLHLLRNAVAHGIESPQIRIKKDKPETGGIVITISQGESRKIKICLSDDGAGIDLEKIKEKSIADGLISKENLQKLTESDILNIIFRSEFTTNISNDDISGRGLGLPIAKEKVEKLGGFISVITEVDKGTSFFITVPAAMGSFRGVLVKAGSAKFIIPISEVKYTFYIQSEAIKTMENREILLINEQAILYMPLADVLKLPRKPRIDKAQHMIPILLLSANDMEIAFSVDAILNEEEILLKSLGRQLQRVINISGAALLDSNELVPILNGQDLIKSAIKISGGSAVLKEKIKVPPPQSVLLIEDSITSRMLLKNILESAGYQVTTAVDGVAGWILLQQKPFDIVVSDIDMPGMNGFELTAKIRADKNLTRIPVVLVTGLETKEDREKGIEVGANAYITKSNFDQSYLLTVMKKII